MAQSLSAKLSQPKNKKKRVRNLAGRMVETDDQELTQMADSAGIQTPLSPKAAEGIGASPDQAKMAGTKQQKEPVLEQAQQVQPQDTLQTAQRTAQARTQQTGSEQAKQQRAEDLTARYGSLGTSVANLINTKIGEQEVLASGSWTVDEDLTADLDDDQKTALDAFAANPTDVAAQQAAAQALGISAADTDIATKLQEYIKADNAAELLATQLPDQIQASEVLSELGTDEEELQELLGIDPASIQGMTLQDLQDKLEFTARAEFDQISELEALATDPAASPQERAEARKQLKAMGATGMYAVEAGMEDLVAQIDQADTLQIGDEEISVEEMLSDEHMSSVIAEYLEGDEDARTEIQDDYGADFASWIEGNEAVLAEASAELDTSLGQLTESAEARQALTETLGSDIIEAIFPGWDEFSGDPEDAPAIIQMSLDGSLQPEDLGMIRSELEGLDADDLAEAEWMKDADQVKQFVAWKKLESGRASPDELFGLLLGPDVSSEDAEEMLLTNQFLLKKSPEMAILDADGDGRIDDQRTLLESFKKMQGVGELDATNFSMPENFGSEPISLSDKLGKADSIGDALAHNIVNFPAEQVGPLFDKLSGENKKLFIESLEEKADELFKKASKKNNKSTIEKYLARIPRDNEYYSLRKKLSEGISEVNRQRVKKKDEARKAKPKRKSKPAKKRKSGTRRLIESGAKGFAKLLGG